MRIEIGNKHFLETEVGNEFLFSFEGEIKTVTAEANEAYRLYRDLISEVKKATKEVFPDHTPKLELDDCTHLSIRFYFKFPKGDQCVYASDRFEEVGKIVLAFAGKMEEITKCCPKSKFDLNFFYALPPISPNSAKYGSQGEVYHYKKVADKNKWKASWCTMADGLNATQSAWEYDTWLTDLITETNPPVDIVKAYPKLKRLLEPYRPTTAARMTEEIDMGRFPKTSPADDYAMYRDFWLSENKPAESKDKKGSGEKKRVKFEKYGSWNPKEYFIGTEKLTRREFEARLTETEKRDWKIMLRFSRNSDPDRWFPTSSGMPFPPVYFIDELIDGDTGKPSKTRLKEKPVEVKTAELTLGESQLGVYRYVGQMALKKAVITPGPNRIPAYCFYGCENLEEVFVPSTVTHIDILAFAYCKKLKKIHFEDPNSIRVLHYGAFLGCEVLDLPFFPSINVTDDAIYEDCKALSKKTLYLDPDKYDVQLIANLFGKASSRVKEILFRSDKGAIHVDRKSGEVRIQGKEMDLPRSWRIIPANCRRIVIEEGVTSVKLWTETPWSTDPVEIVIPSTLASFAFDSQQDRRFVLQGDNPHIRLVDGDLYNHAKTALIAFGPDFASNLPHLPETLKSITSCPTPMGCHVKPLEAIPAFMSDELALNQLRLFKPYVENKVVYYSKAGNKHYILNGGMGFNEKVLTLPADTRIIRSTEGLLCKRLIVSDGVTTLLPYSFAQGTIEEVYLPDSITVIPHHCFVDNTSIRVVRLPSKLLRLDDQAFWCAKNLEPSILPLPSTLRYHGKGVFWGCSLFPKDLRVRVVLLDKDHISGK